MLGPAPRPAAWALSTEERRLPPERSQSGMGEEAAVACSSGARLGVSVGPGDRSDWDGLDAAAVPVAAAELAAVNGAGAVVPSACGGEFEGALRLFLSERKESDSERASSESYAWSREYETD